MRVAFALAVLSSVSLGCVAVFHDAAPFESPSVSTESSHVASFSVAFDGLQERHRQFAEAPAQLAIEELRRFHAVGRSDLVPRSMPPGDAHLEFTVSIEENSPPLLPFFTVITLGIVPSWSNGDYRGTLRVHSATGESRLYEAAEEARMAMGWIFLPVFIAQVSAAAGGDGDAHITGVFRSLYRSLLAQAAADLP